jgi:hypothetical protein
MQLFKLIDCAETFKFNGLFVVMAHKQRKCPGMYIALKDVYGHPKENHSFRFRTGINTS